MIPSIQMNKTTEKVGRNDCIVLFSKQEARKLTRMVAQIEIWERLTDSFGDSLKILIFKIVFVISNVSFCEHKQLIQSPQNKRFISEYKMLNIKFSTF